MKAIPRMRWRTAALVSLVVVPVWAGLRYAAYDFDRDGWRDSIRIGTLDLHLLATESDPKTPTAHPAGSGRLYNAPPDYVHVLVQKAFHWDQRWEVVRWDGPSRAAELSRRADSARVSLHVEKWKGWALVRVTIQGRGAQAAAEEQLVDEAFRCLEDLLYYRMPKPRIIKGFSPVG